jgi:sarcosine oxidase, subunit gamma
MLEVRYRTARTRPLGHAAPLEAVGPGIQIQPAGAEARFSLRTRKAAGPVAGLPLDGPMNSLRGDSGRWIARLGPDEWLIGTAESEADPLAAAIGADLGGTAHALVDVSHRNVGIDVSGTHAAILLNAGCPLDLGDAAFPGGSATRTLLGKAEIVLIRWPGATPRYRVECWRSFATYVHSFLVEAALGTGSAPKSTA